MSSTEASGATAAIEWLSGMAFILTWLAGAVLAQGFASTAAACCFPPYAWYLVVERLMRACGLVA